MELHEVNIRRKIEEFENDVRELEEWMHAEQSSGGDGSVIAEIQSTCNASRDLLRELERALERFRTASLTGLSLSSNDIHFFEHLGFVIPHTSPLRTGTMASVSSMPSSLASSAPNSPVWNSPQSYASPPTMQEKLVFPESSSSTSTGTGSAFRPFQDSHSLSGTKPSSSDDRNFEQNDSNAHLGVSPVKSSHVSPRSPTSHTGSRESPTSSRRFSETVSQQTYLTTSTYSQHSGSRADPSVVANDTSMTRTPSATSITVLELQDKLQSCERRALEFSQELKMSNDEVFHLRSRVANLDREIKDYQERESASSREFQELRSRLGVVETEHDNLRKAVHNERSAWEEERRDLQLRASSSGSQHLEELVAKKSSQINDMTSRIASLEADLSTARSSIDPLRHEKESLSKRNEQLLLELKERDEEIADLKKNMGDATDATLRAKDTEIKLLTDRLLKLEGDLKNFETGSQKNETLTIQLSEVQQLNKTLSERVESLQVRENEVQQLNKTLSEQVESLQFREKELVEIVSSQRNSLSEIESVRQELTTAQERSKSLEDALRRAHEESNRFKELFESLQVEAEKFRSKAKFADAHKRALAEKEAELNAARNEFSEQLAAAKKEHNELRKEVQELARSSSSDSDLVRDLRSRLEETIRQKAEVQNLLEQYRKNFHATNVKLEAAQEQLDELHAERDEFVNSTFSRSNSLGESKDGPEERLYDVIDSVVKKENALLRKVIEQMQDEMARRKDSQDEELSRLKGNLEKLERQLQEGYNRSPGSLLGSSSSPYLLQNSISHSLEKPRKGNAYHSYTPFDSSDNLDVAVAECLSSLPLQSEISYQRLTPGEYFFDRKLKLRLVNGDVMIRKSSGYEPLVEYVARLDDRIVSSSHGSTGSSPPDNLRSHDSSKRNEERGSRPSSAPPGRPRARPISSVQKPTESSMRHAHRGSHRSPDESMHRSREHPQVIHISDHAPDSDKRIRELHREALRRQFEAMRLPSKS